MTIILPCIIVTGVMVSSPVLGERAERISVVVMENGFGLRGHRVQDPARAEAKRRRILLAAAQVFAEKGYAETRMEDIAQAFDATVGTLYYYFRSKEDIFVEIRKTAVSDAVTRLERIVAQGGSPAHTLRAAMADLIAHIFGTVEGYAVILDPPHNLSAERWTEIRNLERHYERLIEETIARGMAEGVFAKGDPKLMAFTVLRGAIGVGDWYRPTGPWSQEFVVEQVSLQLVRSVLAESDLV